MRIFLSRFLCLDVDTNLARMAEEAAQAARAGADLCVFPESFLHGYTRTLDPARIRRAFQDVSRAHPETAFLFGSFSEDRRNRMTLWENGIERTRYDKVHLFAPNGEHELWEPGTAYAAVRVKEWTLGLINCNDLRFPEQARALRMKATCDLLVAVAWWPWRRDHTWRTLLQARAIENAVFTVGCCVAGSQYPGEDFAGAGNHAFDPLGDPIPTADDHLYVLDRHRLDAVMIDPLQTYVEIDRLTVS